MRRLLVLAAHLACVAPLGAQLSAASPATASAAAGRPTGIEGIVLPAGFAEHRGMLYRLAAKAELALTARNAGEKLGDRYEIHRLLARDGTTSMAAIAAALQQQGWTVTPIAGSTTDAWLDRAGRRVLLVVRVDAKEAWAYLAPSRSTASAMVATAAGSSAPDASAPASPAPAVTPATESAPPVSPALAAAPTREYVHARSNFDDGWTAYEGTGGVKAEKGTLTAWLFMARAVAASAEQGTPGEQLWKSDVLSWFTPRSVARRTQGADGTPIEYVEAEGTVVATGQPAFVAMYAAQPGNVGIYRNIVLVGPDRATTQGAYATPEAMFRLLQYNKFALDAADLPGTWVQRGTWAMQLAYVEPARVQGEPVTAQLELTADGRYTSREVARGADGGAAERSSAGTWRLADLWTLVLTDAAGHAAVFDAQFEVVQGGRVLHLVHREDRAVQYHLTLARTP